VAEAGDADALGDALVFAFFDGDADALGVGVALGFDDDAGAWMHHDVFVTFDVMPFLATVASAREG